MSITDRLRCGVPSDWANDFSQCLFEWQGLEGGGLAILAALFGAKYLRRQIRQAQQHRQDDIDRRHIAAKLTMPLALSGVVEATQKIANEIASELETYGPEGFDRTLEAILGDRANRKGFESIDVSADLIGVFERFVETLSRYGDIKHVSELIANLQILVSRFNQFDLQSAGARSSLEALLLNAATVKALCGAMFNYVRNIDDSSFGIVGVLPNDEAWQIIRGAAHGLVFSRTSPDHFFPAINEMVSRYIENGYSPWLEKFVP